jgi:YidC/Oxa1 family membrane protein insertase
MAKMRKFQPRIEQLKERYGDDKQKFQMAMLELYKKEKINPAGGCLPILIQMPVFLALYYVLLEARGTAPGAVDHGLGQRPHRARPVLHPADPQRRGHVADPEDDADGRHGPDAEEDDADDAAGDGVMFAFFPAGLVLYWVTNGALGMLQQWWNTKRYAAEDRREGLSLRVARPKPA